MRKRKMTPEERNLYRRYLIWCYKTTKEDLERIDRKFTQLDVDDFLLKEFHKAPELKDAARDKKFHVKVFAFQQYMEHKKKSAYADKYEEGRKGELKADYWYLRKRLDAVKKAVRSFLGSGELVKIEKAYEQEMISRILKAREHN
ncbi:MAG TPA: hypothetical protein PLT76_06350 [Candidatus Omnitrophota bacterium]|nr:hypothetical protein [Candidatus Omnitrophota bacterium]HQO58326.1 hypothetical protein [Candidatus Omnitrophota bacterium]